MLNELLKERHIILGSGSPRRKFFLEELGLEFEVRLKEIDESYPEGLKGEQISDFLAREKAAPFLDELGPKDILVTADTIVWLSDHALGKPRDSEEAKRMLLDLSCSEHEVISSVALTTSEKQVLVNESTRVKFKCLQEKEIDYYVENYKPLDKAGAYGIQEWIGLVGVEWIVGSYFNVMGFPVRKFYEALREF